MATLIELRKRSPTKTLKKAKGYVELLARSNFSFLQGASHPEEMVQESIRQDYDGIALCDLNGLYGVVRGFQASQSTSLFTASLQAKEGYRYLLGSEMTLTDETSIVLLPLNKQGYSDLCEIITLAKRQATKGFSKMSLEQIIPFSEHLLCLALPPWSDERYEQLEDNFQDRLYLPIWRDLTWESREFCKQAFLLEQRFEAQLFVTQRPFMHTPERKELFDVLTCIHHHTTLEEARDRLISNAERHLHSIEDISSLWQDRIDLVEKTVDIAARVKFSLSEIQYKYPHAQIPEGLSSSEYLEKLALEGALERYNGLLPEKVQSMIRYEINLIRELKYEDYFLTLKEICDFAKERQILYQGRGSAANSVVCYCIGLTSVDPIEVDLLFERFISKERHEPPDIDIDFEHSRREEVLQHIYEKYDARHAAMICTVIRYRSRMALRETAKVFGIPLKTINEMVKFMGRDGMRRLLEPGGEERFQIPAQDWKMILNLTQQLHGYPRHLGIHSGGFLITHDCITQMAPVEKATKDGRYVVQWNKDDVATLCLMKIDLLSLGMLTCLQKSFQLLKNHKDDHLQLHTIPPDDSPTYEMICEADTVGVFQIESRAQMNTLPRMRPQCFYDLVIEVALVRPGPLQGGMVHPYLKRRQGLESYDYPHPCLKPILDKTHGVPIFQEQVMKIVIEAAGFSPGEADELRRIMSSAWRKRSSMDSIRERILQGFLKKGLSLEYGEQIYKTIEGFANYGFPESHAASFAILTYASCYIKKHHPDVFVCSLLNSQPMGFYAPRTLIAEAQRNAVEFLPLCVQSSSYDYTLVGKGSSITLLPVRVGLIAIHSVPETLLRRIEKERHLRGPYQDLRDFIQRTELPRSVLMRLAASGALECFEGDARKLIWYIESISLDSQSFLWGQAKSAQSSFEETLEEEDPIPFESNWDQLRREYDTKSYSLTAHPLSILRTFLEQKNDEFKKMRFVPYFSSMDLKSFSSNKKVRLAGLVSVTQRPPTAKGMCFITLEDEFGFMNIVIHPQIYQKYRLVIYGKSLLEVQGTVERVGKIINIRAERVIGLQ